MERNRKKSRAVIITFFIVLALLFLFYILFVKNNPLDNTKGTSTENRGFFSLFTSSKNKDLQTVEDDTNKEGENTNGDTQNSTEGNNNGSGGEVVGGTVISGGGSQSTNNPLGNIPDLGDTSNPRLRPIPTPDDPDYDFVNDLPDPDVRVYPTPDTDPIKQCNLDDYKLKFTEEEQAELDKLLREFYRIAASIKTEEDIELEHEAKLSYIGLVDEAKDLTKQCYAELNSATYRTGFDWTNAQNELDSTPQGTWISRNHSRLNEARTEQKPNPWYGWNKEDSGYFYNGTILERSERFSRYHGKIGNGTDYRVDGESYDARTFADSVDARNACIYAGQARAISEQNKLNAKYPSTKYSVSYRCFMLEGLVSNTAGRMIVNTRSNAWYPDQNWDNTSNSDIDPKEYYLSESACKKRATSCTQKYKDDPLSSTIRLKPFEWAYTVTVRSPYFADKNTCDQAITTNNHKNAACGGTSSENAYIFKLWNQGLVSDGKDSIDGYVPPIDYPIFEKMFGIW